MKDFKFRAYSASESPSLVMNDLVLNHVPQIVIARPYGGETFWYVFDVDDELLARLRHSPQLSLERSLDLHERGRSEVTIDTAPIFKVFEPGLYRPKVVLGDAGEVRGIVNPVLPHLPAFAPPAEERIYAGVHCEKATVEPDVEMAFNVSLGAGPQLGYGTEFEVKFPDDKDQIEIHAEVSSSDFSRPAGTVWYETFTVTRKLQCKPESWTFKARGLGERRHYSLSVQFSSEGTVLGSIVATLPRAGRMDLPAVIRPTSMNLPSRSGARLHIRMTREGSGIVFNVSADGARQELPIPSERDPQVFGYFFDKLGTAASFREIEEQIINGLDAELPEGLKRILSQHMGLSTLFSGTEPLAPFQLLQLNPVKRGQLLGIERPCSRWVTSEMDDFQSLRVKRVGCIRPTYQNPEDKLPDAEEEETLLRKRFPDDFVLAENKAGFDNLLNLSDVDLLHFAGHADGNPAYLSLPDYRVEAGSFGRSKPLFQNRKPFFFVNGCRTGIGVQLAPAIVGNFIRALLSRNLFCGVLAPSIKVNTRSARKVAEIFYDKTLSSSLSVDTALQDIRELALKDDLPDEERASMLSYLAFVRPGLKLV
jgi:Ternary complex associated domain 7